RAKYRPADLSQGAFEFRLFRIVSASAMSSDAFAFQMCAVIHERRIPFSRSASWRTDLERRLHERNKLLIGHVLGTREEMMQERSSDIRLDEYFGFIEREYPDCL